MGQKISAAQNAMWPGTSIPQQCTAMWITRSKPKQQNISLKERGNITLEILGDCISMNLFTHSSSIIVKIKENTRIVMVHRGIEIEIEHCVESKRPIFKYNKDNGRGQATSAAKTR